MRNIGAEHVARQKKAELSRKVNRLVGDSQGIVASGAAMEDAAAKLLPKGQPERATQTAAQRLQAFLRSMTR